MAPPRKHETDAILDATRALILTEGPRAASVAAIAKVSGAPAGTLYHRFGNRNGVVTAAWLRALERFQGRVLAAAADDPVDEGVAMAVAAVEFAGDLPDDARLLLALRPGDLVDGDPDPSLQETLAAMNAPLISRLHDVTRRLYGDPGDKGADRDLDAVTRAVVDLPYAVIRRHARDDRLPSWLADDLAVAVRALLAAHRPAGGS
ncbi:TetR/AcrR family transcriptional regulator [Mycolicibacterium arseniciresistens]|uniref:TetR/AcrR family transcriptional regulator n=1 Tax=Mycolicibacterium arseniciresistens TaxID=3062257 RepID=A0ABT8UL19_9MYCO|nr:TetR/AcrR family transcriptional regulator [Mycolicibacterium arseniciresistens]MDO3637515.1 TetR/AcrR family transcriptional regulator [Mycolicibacterium arseniciresistens]